MSISTYEKIGTFSLTNVLGKTILLEKGGKGMVIVEHKNTGDIEHIVEYEKMDGFIRNELESGVYFTIKARSSVESDRTYKAPTGENIQ